MISKQARAADTEALRLSKLAAMGIETSMSQRFAVSTLRPVPSAPTTTATGSVNSSKPSNDVADPASNPTIQTPPSLRRLRDSGMEPTTATGRVLRGPPPT